jgi:hypothetical protein
VNRARPCPVDYDVFLTMTTNVDRLELPLESFAWQVTVVRPIGNKLPDRG